MTHAQPFPGDQDFHNDEVQPELHFRVSKSTTTPEYVIGDYLVGTSVVVPESLLKKPRFNIGRWYARQRGQEWLQDKTMWQEAVMGHASITVATKLLADRARMYFPAMDGDANPA